MGFYVFRKNANLIKLNKMFHFFFIKLFKYIISEKICIFMKTNNYFFNIFLKKGKIFHFFYRQKNHKF